MVAEFRYIETHQKIALFLHKSGAYTDRGATALGLLAVGKVVAQCDLEDIVWRWDRVDTSGHAIIAYGPSKRALGQLREAITAVMAHPWMHLPPSVPFEDSDLR